MRRPGCPQRYSTFTQQEMWACRPVLTPAWAVGIFMLLGVIFIPLGAASLSATRSVVEVSQRYDADCISGTTSAAREQTLMDQGGNGGERRSVPVSGGAGFPRGPLGRVGTALRCLATLQFPSGPRSHLQRDAHCALQDGAPGVHVL